MKKKPNMEVNGREIQPKCSAINTHNKHLDDASEFGN